MDTGNFLYNAINDSSTNILPVIYGEGSHLNLFFRPYPDEIKVNLARVYHPPPPTKPGTVMLHSH